MATRTVTGTLRRTDGTPWDGAEVLFYRSKGSFTNLVTYPPDTYTAVADATGVILQELWCNADGNTPTEYLCVLPNKDSFRFVLDPSEAAPTSLELLRMQAMVVGWQPLTVDDYVEAAIGAETTVRIVMDTQIRVEAGLTGTLAAAVATGKRDIRIVADETLSANLVIPNTMTVRVAQGAVITVPTGLTLTINGPLKAGRQRIFAGDGTVNGSPRIQAAFPEWFGAAGLDQVVDTLAFQRATNLHRVVRGDGVTDYLINTQRTQWHVLDLHRAGRYFSGGWQSATAWDNGYWTGVEVPNGHIFTDCRFALNYNLAQTPTWRTTRYPVGFSWGDKTSSTRHHGGGFRRCVFVPAPTLPVPGVGGALNTPSRPHLALAQSTDNWSMRDCEVISPDALVTDRRQIGAVYLFDSHDSLITKNYYRGAQAVAIYEFCEGMTFSHNRLRNCRTAIDLDKRCLRGHFHKNTVISDDLEQIDSDAIFEINGSSYVTLTANIVKNQQRYAIFNTKYNVYNTWADVLAQSQGADSYSFTVSNHIVSDGNLVERTRREAVRSGAGWEDEEDVDPDTGAIIVIPSAHNGTPCGDGLYLNDQYIDCNVWGGQSNTSAVVSIVEGTGIVFGPNFRISGGASGPNPNGGPYSAWGASTVSTLGAQRMPTSNNNHFYTVTTPGTSGATEPAWPTTSGASVADGTAVWTESGPYWPLGTNGVYATSAITVNGVPAGATTWSNLRIDRFAGVIENTPWEGVYVRYPSRVQFANLLVRSCGLGRTNTRQALIISPEVRSARIGGSLTLDPGDATIATGLMLYSQMHATGGHLIDVSNWTIHGHTLDLEFDSTTGGEGSSAQRVRYFRQQREPDWLPSNLGGTGASPFWSTGGGGKTARWVFTHGTQGLLYFSVMVPQNIGRTGAMTVMGRIHGTTTTQAVESRRYSQAAGVGDIKGWEASSTLESTSTLGEGYQDVVIANVSTMSAGDILSFAWRPRGMGDTALTQDVFLLGLWVR